MRLLLLSLLCLDYLGAQVCHGPGKERWPVKVGVPEGTRLNTARRVEFSQLAALEDPQGIKHNDPRFQSARIPAFTNSLKTKEGDLLTTRGWLYLVATEDDCDYHIQISDKPRTTTDKPQSEDNCIVVEAPNPDNASATDLKDRYQTVRAFIKAKLLAGKEPSNSGSVMQHPVYVEVTGALFYDDAHLGANGEKQPRGKKGMHSRTLWELHPVTAIRFAPAPKK